MMLAHTYRLQYSINITFYVLVNQKIHVTYFIAIFALLWQSRPKPVVALRYAGNFLSQRQGITL